MGVDSQKRDRGVWDYQWSERRARSIGERWLYRAEQGVK